MFVRDRHFAEELVWMHAVGNRAAAIGLSHLEQLRIAGAGEGEEFRVDHGADAECPAGEGVVRTRHQPIYAPKLPVSAQSRLADELPKDAPMDHDLPSRDREMKAA